MPYYEYTRTARTRRGYLVTLECGYSVTPNGGGDYGEDWTEDDDSRDDLPTINHREVSEAWPTAYNALMALLDKHGTDGPSRLYDPY